MKKGWISPLTRPAVRTLISPPASDETTADPVWDPGPDDIALAFADPNLAAFIAWIRDWIVFEPNNEPVTTHIHAKEAFDLAAFPAEVGGERRIEIVASIPKELLPIPPAWLDMKQNVGAVADQVGGTGQEVAHSNEAIRAEVDWVVAGSETYQAQAPGVGQTHVVRHTLTASLKNADQPEEMETVTWAASFSTGRLSGNDTLVGNGVRHSIDDILASIRTIDVPLMGVCSLNGIERLVNLRELNVERNGIATLAPVSGLTKLGRLNASLNDLESIAGIENLGELTSLKVSRNRIHDLAPLAGLRELISLDIAGNEVCHLAPLAGLSAPLSASIAPEHAEARRLRILRASGNGISDVSPLGDLPCLWNIDVSNNDIRDIEPLAHPARLDGLRQNSGGDGQPTPIGLDEEEREALSVSVIHLGDNPLDLATGSQAAGVIDVLEEVQVEVLVADMPHV